MNITRDESLEAVVMDEMRQSFREESREGIHLTDLLNPRWAYWSRMDPKQLNNDQVLYFLAGRGHEDAFARLHGYERGTEQEQDGIRYRADFYTSIPIEFKTRRRGLAKPGEEPALYATYLEQIKGYAALGNRSAAWLFVLSLVESMEGRTTKPALHCYRVEFTWEELRTYRATLIERKTALDFALQKRCHDQLPLCWAFKCGSESSTLLEHPRCLTCDREFQTDWGIDKHLASKPGHQITHATYTRSYVPKCPWYAACRPYLVDSNRK